MGYPFRSSWYSSLIATRAAKFMDHSGCINQACTNDQVHQKMGFSGMDTGFHKITIRHKEKTGKKEYL
jgi:hypothetical protein